MAGPLTQSESDVVHRRLINIATRMRDIAEEIERLKSENTTFDFATNLDDPSHGAYNAATAVAFVTGPMFAYADFWDNVAVSTDGTSGSSDRRDKANPLLLAEPLS